MKIRRIALSVIVTLAFPLVAGAQYADSTALRTQLKSSDFKASQLIAPGALLAGGALIHFAAHDAVDVELNDCTSKWKGDGPVVAADNYLRFLPGAMHLGLGLAGADAEHSLRDRAIEAVWAFGSYVVVTTSLKYIVNSPRPDLSDNKSFPSGHAGMAFTGAELVRMEYGWGWGAGAYALAAGVCVLRMYNNEHWFSDLLTGAGVGVLCAHIGGWLLEPTKRLLGIREDNLALSATVDPVSGALCPALALRF